MLLREGIRKSVKFELVAARFIIEISTTMAHTIAIVATPEGMRRFGAMSAFDVVDGCAGRPAEGRRCKSVAVKA